MRTGEGLVYTSMTGGVWSSGQRVTSLEVGYREEDIQKYRYLGAYTGYKYIEVGEPFYALDLHGGYGR
ncbi:hypothetical protein GCM10009037_29830 [Halarchaeum grantii]|uniref:Uncharacterized protein n=2 Tax=Halarchaeum TaxID=744724 RepID=A0A830FDI7_9EURY|nr:hypothetical protein GCM10009037_29830 [Halarchaeum grantii]